MVILVKLDVVLSNNSFLDCLDVLDKFHVIMDNVENVLRCYGANCETSLVWKFRHIYLDWPKGSTIFNTTEKLRKLHRNVFLPALINCTVFLSLLSHRKPMKKQIKV